MAKLRLPTVTLCAATSVNLAATVAALEDCMVQVDFAECLLFTDTTEIQGDSAIRIVPVARMSSSRAYSKFLLHGLAEHVRTDHCLVVQWDGFILDADCWRPEFLDYDYIGAPWPQFTDGHDVGNGGFSLRSKRLLDACRNPAFGLIHPEDVAICRANRRLLEQQDGIRFADRAIAERFAYERSHPSEPAFGFHGIFNMIPALGPERFWHAYRSLDERSTAFMDYGLLMRQLGAGPNAAGRRAKLTFDRLLSALRS